MLWLCCEFTLGDKLVYWSAALWAFFGWTVRCLQPNGEGRRACSYLSLFSLVCAQQSDFDRRKSHGTVGIIEIRVVCLKNIRYLMWWGSLWSMFAADWSPCSRLRALSRLLGSDLASSYHIAYKTEFCHHLNNFAVTWTQFFTPEEGVTVFVRNVGIHL